MISYEFVGRTLGSLGVVIPMAGSVETSRTLRHVPISVYLNTADLKRLGGEKNFTSLLDNGLTELIHSLNTRTVQVDKLE